MRALRLKVVGHAQATCIAVCTPSHDPTSGVLQEAKVPWADTTVQPAAVRGAPGLQLALHVATAVISLPDACDHDGQLCQKEPTTTIRHHSPPKSHIKIWPLDLSQAVPRGWHDTALASL